MSSRNSPPDFNQGVRTRLEISTRRRLDRRIDTVTPLGRSGIPARARFEGLCLWQCPRSWEQQRAFRSVWCIYGVSRDPGALNQTGSKGLPQMSPDWSTDSARSRAACGYRRFVQDEIRAATGKHPASLERSSLTSTQERLDTGRVRASKGWQHMEDLW
jgi:hypothetical protein